MDYFNPQCQPPRCGQPFGTYIPDTDCGVPPTTIMPRMSSPYKGNRAGTMMTNTNMENIMPNTNEGTAMPERMPLNGAAMGNGAMFQNYPIAMAYVPWQKWKQPYSVEEGLKRGTIFPELDLPFIMGRCQ